MAGACWSGRSAGMRISSRLNPVWSAPGRYGAICAIRRSASNAPGSEGHAGAPARDRRRRMPSAARPSVSRPRSWRCPADIDSGDLDACSKPKNSANDPRGAADRVGRSPPAISARGQADRASARPGAAASGCVSAFVKGVVLLRTLSKCVDAQGHVQRADTTPAGGGSKRPPDGRHGAARPSGAAMASRRRRSMPPAGEGLRDEAGDRDPQRRGRRRRRSGNAAPDHNAARRDDRRDQRGRTADRSRPPATTAPSSMPRSVAAWPEGNDQCVGVPAPPAEAVEVGGEEQFRPACPSGGELSPAHRRRCRRRRAP